MRNFCKYIKSLLNTYFNFILEGEEMKKEKTILVILSIIVFFGVLFTGCVDVPKTAKMAISANPNPVPVETSGEEWNYTLQIAESNGVGVTLNGLTFENYHGEGEAGSTIIINTDMLHQWFGTDYIAGYNSIQSEMYHSSVLADNHYVIATVTGIDDNGNAVEATVRIDYIVQ
ncbi:MAG: hypothetical protein WDA32_08510 [Candidatus Caldatribacteriota bacterium]|jgi:hypothetical protein